MNETDKKLATKKANWLIFLFSVVGVVISIISFLIYYNFKNGLIVSGICIVDIIYSYFNAKLFLKSKAWNGVRQLFIPLMMITYWALIFGVVCVGNAILFDGIFSSQLLLYPIFLMPAFVFEILILALAGMGI